MKDFQESTYGDRIAEVYDDLYGGLASPEVVDPMVDVLANLAGGRRALELGIGTGRIALPLAARGVEVHGIDASAAMVEKLRRKPGGDRIPVTLGDFADVEVDGRYSLVYVVFNTFFALLSQEAQVRCFGNVARRLSDGGTFLMEVFAPDLTRFDRGQNIQAGVVETDRVSIHLSRHDAVAQTVATSHMYITEGGVRLYPVKLRYAWPSELDLMARLAGMRLRSRWGDWKGSPFTASSANHVSVYELLRP